MTQRNFRQNPANAGTVALIMWFNGRSESDDYDEKDGMM